jgi:hypothetical protein
MENGRLRTCDSSLRCVTCSVYRLAERREALRSGLRDAPDAASLTLTRSHGSAALAEEWDVTQLILGRLTHRSDWSRFKKRHGIDGYAFAIETTLNDLGWNVHVHGLLTFERPLGQEAVGVLRTGLAVRWCRAAASVGYGALDANQTVSMLRTEDERLEAAVYVTKQSLPHRAPASKRGRYPADLLAAAYAGDADDLDQYTEYLAAAFSRSLIRSYGRLSATVGEPVENLENDFDGLLEGVIFEVQLTPAPSNHGAAKASPENRAASDREHLRGLCGERESNAAQWAATDRFWAEQRREHEAEMARVAAFVPTPIDTSGLDYLIEEWL